MPRGLSLRKMVGLGHRQMHGGQKEICPSVSNIKKLDLSTSQQPFDQEKKDVASRSTD